MGYSACVEVLALNHYPMLWDNVEQLPRSLASAFVLPRGVAEQYAPGKIFLLIAAAPPSPSPSPSPFSFS